MDAEAASAIGAGIACLGMGGAGIGLGHIFGNYLAGALRNPSAADGQFGRLIFGFAVTEALGIFSLLVALLLLVPRAGDRLPAAPSGRIELTRRTLDVRDTGLCPGSSPAGRGRGSASRGRRGAHGGRGRARRRFSAFRQLQLSLAAAVAGDHLRPVLPVPEADGAAAHRHHPRRSARSHRPGSRPGRRPEGGGGRRHRRLRAGARRGEGPRQTPSASRRATRPRRKPTPSARRSRRASARSSRMPKQTLPPSSRARWPRSASIAEETSAAIIEQLIGGKVDKASLAAAVKTVRG